MSTKNQKIFLKVFFSLLFIFSVFKIYDNTVSRDAWQYGEWLINYQSGFVRRGLIGEIIYYLSLGLQNNIAIATVLLVASICLIYYSYLYQLFKRVNINYVWLLLFFSPLIFFFIINTNKIGIHKITILYAFYIYYLLELTKNNLSSIKFVSIHFLLLVSLLIYEGYFFYFPYFMLPTILVSPKAKQFKLIIFYLGFIVLATLLMLILFYFKGETQNALGICESLGEFAPMKCNWWGAIGAFSFDYSQGLQMVPVEHKFFGVIPQKFYMHDDLLSYLGLLTYLVYSLFPFYLFYLCASSKIKNLKKSLWFIIIFSLPLFHIAEDWLRWVSYHTNFMLYLLAFLVIKKLLTIEKSKTFSSIKKLLDFKVYRNLFIVFLFLYPIFLQHHHFFWKGVRLEFTVIKLIKKQLN